MTEVFQKPEMICTHCVGLWCRNACNPVVESSDEGQKAVGIRNKKLQEKVRGQIIFYMKDLGMPDNHAILERVQNDTRLATSDIREGLTIKDITQIRSDLSL